MSPWEDLYKGAQSYGQAQGQGSFYAQMPTIGQNLGTVAANYGQATDNPWLGALGTIGGNFLGGYGQGMQNQIASQGTNQALGAMFDAVRPGGSGVVAPEYRSYMMPYNVGMIAENMGMQRELAKEYGKMSMQNMFDEMKETKASNRLRNSIFGGNKAPFAAGPSYNQPETLAQPGPEVPAAEDVINQLEQQAPQPTPELTLEQQAFNQSGGDPELYADRLKILREDRDRSYKMSQDEISNIRDQRKDFEAKSKDFLTSDIGFKSLTKAIEDPASTSDLELVRGAIQAIEPGMAVREGEAAAAQNSDSIPNAWKAQIDKALNGKSGLSPEVRQGILRIAARRYNEHAQKYNEQLQFYGDEFKRMGIDPSRLGPYEPAKTAEEIYPKLANQQQIQSAAMAEARRRGLIK